MSDPSHESLRISLGAYVLGGLTEADRRAVEAHLATCADCRAEHDELVPVASSLGELRGGPAATDPGADLRGRVTSALAAEAALERHRAWRRRAVLTAIGGAAAGVVLVVGLALTRPQDPPPVPLEAVPVEILESEVAATADLVAHTWGVEVRLTATGFDDGGRYRVDVVDADGRRFPAGEFVGTGSREMVCSLNSSLLRDEAAGFEVRDAGGAVVVSSSFA